MEGSPVTWNLMPSGLWETKKELPYGFIYRCTECRKVSTEWSSLRKMHKPDCERITRGNRKKRPGEK